MPPRRGSSEQQQHPPATGHHGRDEDAPSQAPASLPVIGAVAYEKKKQDQDHEQVALPDDVLIEILSQMSYRSLCRFKCVSKSWHALCSDLDIYKKSPQTVPGIFFGADNSDRLAFHSLTAGGPPLVDPTLAFLGSYEHIRVKQCCGSGLLLCKCWESCSQDKYSYVVCNPATEKSTVLPPVEFLERVDGQHFDLNGADCILCFDRVRPSRFVVAVPMAKGFEEIRGVTIYSSETGRWTSMKSQWSSRTSLLMDCRQGAIFLNGRMHFTSFPSSIVTVDIEGKAWREIQVPKSYSLGSIGQSQGYLHFWHLDNDYQLCVWVLEDYGSENWTVKHTVNILELFGENSRGYEEGCYIAIHPDCNLIFLTGSEMTISYDMDSQKMHVICSSEQFVYVVPYIPCFAQWPSDRHRKVAVAHL